MDDLKNTVMSYADGHPKITVKELAEKFGVSTAVIYKWRKCKVYAQKKKHIRMGITKTERECTDILAKLSEYRKAHPECGLGPHDYGKFLAGCAE